MSIFKKEDNVSAEVEAKVDALTKQNSELLAKVANFELKEKLAVTASKIGFSGDVSALMVEGVTFESAMDSMLENIDTTKKEENASFQETGSEEAEEGNDAEFVAKTQTDALTQVKNEYNLTGRDASVKATELYPDLFN